MTIAALHRISFLAKPSVNDLRIGITAHIISGQCSQFSDRHADREDGESSAHPDCADICNDWHVNSLDADLQLHVLSRVLFLMPVC